MKCPRLWQVDSLAHYYRATTTHVRIHGVLVPARPIGFPSLRNRIRCAWLVFTCRADAVEWQGQ